MKPERTAEALRKIDEGLEAAQNITIEQGIEEAIANGLPIREAELILEHFRAVFHKE